MRPVIQSEAIDALIDAQSRSFDAARYGDGLKVSTPSTDTPWTKAALVHVKDKDCHPLFRGNYEL